MVNDTVDTALDSEDIEDEIEEEVDKVLTAIAGETAAELPEAVRKERVKQPAQSVSATEVFEIYRPCNSRLFFPFLFTLWFSCPPSQTNLAIDYFLQEDAIAEGVDDEEEMEEIRARLAKVRS